MLVPLYAADRQQILDHYLRLDPDDRYLRFFSPVSDYALNDFVQNHMDFEEGATFGIMIDGLLVGVGYVSRLRNDGGQLAAEAGFSIDKKHRSHGHASLLMSAIIGFCMGAKVDKLFMSCLRQNKKMQKLAQNFGLHVVVDDDEAYADLNFKEA